MTQRGQKAENRRHEVPGPDGTAQSLDKDLQEKRAGEAKKIPNKQNNTTIGAAQETYRDAKDADAQVHGMGLDPRCCEILEQRPEEDSKVSREKDMRAMKKLSPSSVDPQDEGPVCRQAFLYV